MTTVITTIAQTNIVAHHISRSCSICCNRTRDIIFMHRKHSNFFLFWRRLRLNCVSIELDQNKSEAIIDQLGPLQNWLIYYLMLVRKSLAFPSVQSFENITIFLSSPHFRAKQMKSCELLKSQLMPILRFLSQLNEFLSTQLCSKPIGIN